MRDEAERRYGAPYYHIHRADLIAVLTDELRRRAPNAVRTRQRRSRASNRRAGASPQASPTARSPKATSLIGADGIHSRVRERLFGPESAALHRQRRLACRRACDGNAEGSRPADRVRLGRPRPPRRHVLPARRRSGEFRRRRRTRRLAKRKLDRTRRQSATRRRLRRLGQTDHGSHRASDATATAGRSSIATRCRNGAKATSR